MRLETRDARRVELVLDRIGEREAVARQREEGERAGFDQAEREGGREQSRRQPARPSRQRRSFLGGSGLGSGLRGSSSERMAA